MSGATDSTADTDRFEEHADLLEINEPRYEGEATTEGVETALAELADG